MAFAYKGFNENTATFADGGAKKGYPVEMKESCTVKSAAADHAFIGICTGVRDGIAGVQLTGYAEAEYAGNAPSLGICQLASNGNNSVKTASSVGRTVTVIMVDIQKKTVGFIL